MRYEAEARARGIVLCVAAYLLAALVAIGVLRALAGTHPVLAVAAADVAATVVVFAASVATGNSSVYDPYWSVAPPLVALAWASRGADRARRTLVILLVTAWAVRLTWNWLRGWQGLGHEDWRYLDLRRKSGRAYWLVSFTGIHLFPTLIVLLGCLSLWPALATGRRPLGALDVVAAAVTAAAIAIEATADEQLRRFRRAAPPPGATLATGLWAYSRHPNYFGETLFWWGLFLFALAADPGAWWTVVGPLTVTLMFLFVSIPMIDERMTARRPDYAAHKRRVSGLVPWFTSR